MVSEPSLCNTMLFILIGTCSLSIRALAQGPFTDHVKQSAIKRKAPGRVQPRFQAHGERPQKEASSSALASADGET